MEEIRVNLVAKDAEILHLRIQNQKVSLEEPGVVEDLTTKNVKLQSIVTVLTTKVQGLKAEVKDLTKKLLNAHVIESARMELLLNFFSTKPPFARSYQLYPFVINV